MLLSTCAHNVICGYVCCNMHFRYIIEFRILTICALTIVYLCLERWVMPLYHDLRH